MRPTLTRALPTGLMLLALLMSGGCKPLFDIRKAMYDQEKYETLEKSDFFGDGRSARPLEEGTVAQGHLRLDEHLYEGIEEIDGQVKPAETYPFEITAADLERGRERYEIFCSVCHGLSGNGGGMVVQRGYKHATAFTEERLRNSPPGYFYNAIANGFGDMYSYADQIPVDDRWRIIAYIQTLQYAQHAPVEDEGIIAPLMESKSTQQASEKKNEHH